ncbi:hypothetical protein ACTHR6_01875 [Ralstonia holmesii]|uniref:GNAT family N-acetyltransferase n=1 Tax=Ralstonia TaxID=48736 RepID=UPI00046A5917|nr:GNAT family N-acetyltransferase [Ralstonia pickettii]
MSDANTIPSIEVLCVTAPDGTAHTICVAFIGGCERAEVIVQYQEGPLCAVPTVLAQWSASYESPIGVGAGMAWLGDGRIDLQIPEMRGIGLGSLLMQPLIHWIKGREHVVDVAPINLAADDAKTDEARRIRNSFYEKLGFRFSYKDQESWGESFLMKSSCLVVPDFRLSNGWKVESTHTEGGSVFQKLR